MPHRTFLHQSQSSKWEEFRHFLENWVKMEGRPEILLKMIGANKLTNMSPNFKKGKDVAQSTKQGAKEGIGERVVPRWCLRSKKLLPPTSTRPSCFGDLLRVPDLLGLIGGEFGKAVDPAGGDPVRRRGVEHLRLGAEFIDQRHRFLAAASGRHSTTRSTSARSARLAAASLRNSGARLRIAMPVIPASRSRMPRPVVPASPSMKMVWVATWTSQSWRLPSEFSGRTIRK